MIADKHFGFSYSCEIYYESHFATKRDRHPEVVRKCILQAKLGIEQSLQPISDRIHMARSEGTDPLHGAGWTFWVGDKMACMG